MLSECISRRLLFSRKLLDHLTRAPYFGRNMNRLAISAVFISGIAFAVVVSLLSDYFRTLSCEDRYESVDRKQFKAFSPLPDESQLNVVDEGTLGLVLLNYHLAENKKEKPESQALVAEAVASMNAARELRLTGRHDKALKLFEHSLALAPRHPDILTHYGEFLEEAKGDILRADQLYRRALCISPSHPLALARSRAAAPAVNKLDRLSLRHLDSLRDALARAASPGDPPGLRRAKREAYFMHIHQSAALEGNTMTLAETRSVVETRQAVPGRSVAEHAEIVGLDAALKYVNTTLAHSVGNVNLTLILEIHRRVLGFVDPLEAGRFRRTQVFVGSHIPPPPKDLPALMETFVAWLNSDAAMHMHPVRHAALAHYKLVALHPFADGNGRTSRLLMNMILMQAGYPPVIIHKRDRHRYYETLQWANEGDVRPFVRFIADCTKQTLDSYLWATEEEARGVQSGRSGVGEVPALSGGANEGKVLDDGGAEEEGQRRNWWVERGENTIIIGDKPGDFGWDDDEDDGDAGGRDSDGGGDLMGGGASNLVHKSSNLRKEYVSGMGVSNKVDAVIKGG
ncbi:protein adenylyltransferase Fic [Ischnura elegans]|uniref:protein adenylyltransferase Fic n=1 Tax=Ischnura elegans TaxID=197161 RepID=UPI001ED8AAF2|nr:protein adenylyltransferase Fic [Ischnura elegans]